MEELLKGILAELKAMRQESARAKGYNPCAGSQAGDLGMEVIGEHGPEIRAFGQSGNNQEENEEGADYGQEFFWKSNVENSREQEDLLGRFLIVTQSIKCVSIDCAFHKMRFGCALKGVYLSHGKCQQFLPREEWLKINGKMGVR